MNHHVLQIVVGIILSLMISGCATVYRSPGSELLKPSEMAVINKSSIHSDIVITTVNGKRRGPLDIIERCELSPGEHSITVALHKDGYTGGEITRWFQAQAGQEYVINAVIDTVAMKWGIAIVDKNLGQRVDYEKPIDTQVSP